MSSEPRLSLVMIAKDEEANLPRALASVAGLVDEIILVDTGSSDRTVQIAEGHGAKVYHHPWQDDFSLHRNQALSYASGDWCLQLDADEELDPTTAPLLRQLIRQPAVNGYWVQTVDLRDGQATALYHLLRLFRRLPEVRYHQRVHNQISVPGRLESCGLRLLHYGYGGDPGLLAAKHSRRQEMIQKWLREEPHNWRPHYYWAQALSCKPVPPGDQAQRRRDLEAVAHHAERALELAQAQGVPAGLWVIAYPLLVEALSLLGRLPQLARHLEDWRRLAPGNPDPLYFLVELNLRAGNWPQVSHWAQEYLRARQQAAAYLAGNPHLVVFTLERELPVLVAWLLAEAHQGDEGGMQRALDRILRSDQGEAALRAALTRLGPAAARLARLAARHRPQWDWLRQWSGLAESHPPKAGPEIFAAR